MKRVISALLAVIMLLPICASAATWITVSSWAYNSVSNLKKENLLPESFDNVDDYTVNITRRQFAELMFSVLCKTKCIDEVYMGYDVNQKDRFGYRYTDTDDIAPRALGYYGVMYGEETGSSSASGGLQIEYTFYPERNLTREEMAAVVYRAAERWCEYLFPREEFTGYGPAMPTDFDEISKWAQQAVMRLHDRGIVSGMEDGSYAPRNNLTIEQAISVLYRFYNIIPSASEADGANLNSQYEQQVQQYKNGIVETKQGDVLYIKRLDDVLMEFETDIYTNIFCETVNGVTYAAAQNIYGRTDVYNADTAKQLFVIPYTTYAATEDYIITKSSNIGPMTFGAYSYDGKELLPPEYSLSEIKEIRDNNFIVPEEKQTAAHGWIYYINSDDGNHLCRIDSNGENKQKLSNRSCERIEYINGRLYYRARANDNEKKYFTVNTDGSDEQLFADNVSFIGDGYSEWNVSEQEPEGYYKHTHWNNSEDKDKLYRNSYRGRAFHDGKWVYYTEYNHSTKRTDLKRISFSDGNMEIENISDGYNVEYVQIKDGIIYFKDSIFREMAAEDQLSGSLYSYDGKNVTKLSGDFTVTDYGFMEDKLMMAVGEDYDSSVTYIADTDGSNPNIMREIKEAKLRHSDAREARNYEIHDVNVLEDFSDDKYTVYTVYKRSEEENIDDYSTYMRDADGNETKIPDSERTPDFRLYDKLYFLTGYDVYNRKDMEITAYDMNTKSRKVVAGGVRDISKPENVTGDSWFTYTDNNFNKWRYNADDNTISEVFPCKGIHSRGNVNCLIRYGGKLYKVDTEGNHSLITDDETADCVYVENGDWDCVHFNLF